MKHLLSILLFLLPLYLQAQVVGDYTEQEITTQTTFVDALLHKHQGKTDKAISLFKDCLASNNKNHAAAFELAKIYLAQDNKEETIKYGAKALEQDPKNRWYQVFMSNTYIESLSYSSAIDILNQLIIDYPKERYFYEQLAYAQSQNSQNDKALLTLDALERVIGIDEDNVKQKFKIYSVQNNTQAAEMELSKLLQSDPRNSRYLANLAQFKYEHGKKDEAVELYKQVLDLDPHNERANFVLAKLDTQDPKGSSTAHPLTKIIENPSIDIDPKIKELIPYVESAQRLDSLKQLQLEDLLSTLRTTHPRSPKATAITADYYNQILDAPKALSWYEKTLALNDNIYNVWEQLMLTQIEIKDYKGLLEKSEEAIDLFPNQVTAYIYHAKALIELGDKSEARNILSEAKLISGNNKQFLKQISALEKEL